MGGSFPRSLAGGWLGRDEEDAPHFQGRLSVSLPPPVVAFWRGMAVKSPSLPRPSRRFEFRLEVTMGEGLGALSDREELVLPKGGNGMRLESPRLLLGGRYRCEVALYGL